MEEYMNSLVEDTSYRDAAYLSLGAMEEYEDSSVEDYMGQKVAVKRNGSLYTYGTSVHCVSLQQLNPPHARLCRREGLQCGGGQDGHPPQDGRGGAEGHGEGQVGEGH